MLFKIKSSKTSFSGKILFKILGKKRFCWKIQETQYKFSEYSGAQ